MDRRTMTTRRTDHQIHLRHRRRRVVARQGARRRLDRLPARGPRLQGHAAEVRPVHQRRPGHDEPVPARRGLRHRRRRGDRPRPRPLRALHQHGHDARTRTGRPARSTRASSRRSGAATTSGGPCRSFRTSPTRSRTRSAPSRNDVDVVLVEIGGTVGDIESLPFLEAIRQFRQDVGRDNSLYIHLTLVPFIGAAGELKTKPTQHSVRDLRSIGIQPDILLCRTDRFLDPDIKRKIALFCDVDEEAVITAKDVVDDLRSAARARRRRARPHRAEVPAPAADRAADAGVGGARQRASRIRSTRSRSTSSASTSATRIRTRASTRRSITAASRTG